MSNKNNPTKKNRKPRQMKTPHSQTIHYQKKQEETLSQEQKVNVENVKRIMSSEKTILPALRNIE